MARLWYALHGYAVAPPRTQRRSIGHGRVLPPEQRDRTVAEVFAEEQPRLLPLPAHPFATDLMRPVRSGKTPYIRFDRNSYSIPHTCVRHPLSVLASATTIRLVDGLTDVARHRRSYGTGETIEDPAHLAGLLAVTRQANAHTARDRLRVAVPVTDTLFDRLATRGAALRPHVVRLLALLDDYGAAELTVAVTHALAQDALGAGSITHLLETRRQRRWSPTVFLERVVAAELEDRQRRSVERRLTAARLGRFKPLADWDWDWPTALDRPALERVLALDFLERPDNVLLVGAQGLGKTMLAKNIVHAAVFAGHTARFTTAADLLLDLNGQETARALDRRLRHYTRPALLAIDEIGYLAYDARAADLLFQIVSRRYEHRAILITTNLPFKRWDTIFPNASCAVALIDRLTHHAEILPIEGDSYRRRDAELSQKQRRAKTKRR